MRHILCFIFILFASIISGQNFIKKSSLINNWIYLNSTAIKKLGYKMDGYLNKPIPLVGFIYVGYDSLNNRLIEIRNGMTKSNEMSSNYEPYVTIFHKLKLSDFSKNPEKELEFINFDKYIYAIFKESKKNIYKISDEVSIGNFELTQMQGHNQVIFYYSDDTIEYTQTQNFSSDFNSYEDGIAPNGTLINISKFKNHKKINQKDISYDPNGSSKSVNNYIYKYSNDSSNATVYIYQDSSLFNIKKFNFNKQGKIREQFQIGQNKKFFQSYLFIRDNTGNVIEKVSYDKNIPFLKEFYSYDKKNNIISFYESFSDKGKVFERRKGINYVYSYNKNGTIHECIIDNLITNLKFKNKYNYAEH